MSSKPTALVVDDHEENVYLLRALLTGSGYQVVCASNGLEALQQARISPPDLVISDILMPKMDGFALCREWKQDPELAPIPFVFYTATYTDDKDERLARTLGADLFIVKPTEPDVFIQMIADVLSRHRAGELIATLPPPAADAAYLREYNEALIRKLEDKVQQLEAANRDLTLKSAMIDASVGGIALCDPERRCTYANASFAKIWGVTSSELVGRSLEDLLGGAAVCVEIMRVVSERGSWVGELRSRRPDGAVLSLQGIIERTPPQERELNAPLMVSLLDVTERRRMQEELQRAHRFEALSIFARSIAHDFNNLLMGLFGNIQLGMMELPPDNPAVPFLDTALRIFERARDLTHRLQAFAKGAPSERKRINLADVLRESCSLSLSGSNVRWQLAIGDDLHAVDADANQLSQVFNNLLINARQAMAGGGTVYVSAANRSQRVTEGVAGVIDTVEVTICDEGPGVPEQLASKIFDPFFTTKPGGSGLGLAISYSIVKDHGGDLTVSSPPGTGACFTVRLPGAVGEPRIEREQPESALMGTGRVLVMDDESMVAETARRMLTLAGYEVLTVADGHEAIEAQKRAIASGQRIDLFILDLTVRGGLGGLEALAALRQADPAAAIILSSGYNDHELVNRAVSAGCTAFIQKPYLLHELLSRVKAAITSRS